jgi:endonuclease YncB( thermonuclease family)
MRKIMSAVVSTQHRIRLQGIDAPEKAQPYGNASRKHLASLVAGKTVTVQWYKHDRYGRIVGTVFVEGRDVDLEQLKAGMAWFYRYCQKELTPEDRKLYAQAERQGESRQVRTVAGQEFDAAVGVAAVAPIRAQL